MQPSKARLQEIMVFMTTPTNTAPAQALSGRLTLLDPAAEAGSSLRCGFPRDADPLFLDGPLARYRGHPGILANLCISPANATHVCWLSQ